MWALGKLFLEVWGHDTVTANRMEEYQKWPLSPKLVRRCLPLSWILDACLRHLIELRWYHPAVGGRYVDTVDLQKHNSPSRMPLSRLL